MFLDLTFSVKNRPADFSFVVTIIVVLRVLLAGRNRGSGGLTTEARIYSHLWRSRFSYFITVSMTKFSVRWRFGAGIDSDSRTEHAEPALPNPYFDGVGRLRLPDEVVCRSRNFGGSIGSWTVSDVCSMTAFLKVFVLTSTWQYCCLQTKFLMCCLFCDAKNLFPHDISS